MPEKLELKARDKTTIKMTKDGLVERNETKGVRKNISKRNREFNIKDDLADVVNAEELEIDPKTEKNSKDVKTAIRKKQVRDFHSKMNKDLAKNEEIDDSLILIPSNIPMDQLAPICQKQSSETTIIKEIDNCIISHKRVDDEETKPNRPMLVEPLNTDKSQIKQKSSFRKSINYAVVHPSKLDLSIKKSEVLNPKDKKQKSPHASTFSMTNSAVDKAENGIKHVPHEELETKPPSQADKFETKYRSNLSTPLKEISNKIIIQKQKKLSFSDDEKVDKKATIAALKKQQPSELKTEESKKLKKVRIKAENTNKNLEESRNKLPKKHKVKFEKQLDKNSGKVKRKLYFKEEIKSQREHMKGALPLRPVKAGLNAGVNFAHMKVNQVQHENVGVEVAHKGETLVEHGFRRAYRFHKTAPYRKTKKLEKKAKKQNINYSYKKALHENPELKSNIISRSQQKQKIKREYAKAIKDSKKAGNIAKKATDTVKEAAKLVVTFVRNNPVVAGIIVISLFLVFFIFSMFSSLSSVATGGLSSVAATSYLANEQEIDSTELAYTEWEVDLLLKARNARNSHPGFDEYVFNIGDVSHDPYELMAYLTAKNKAFTYVDIEPTLRQIFAEQYNLSFAESTAIRYTEDGAVYEVQILTTNLTTRSFSDVIAERLSEEEVNHFNILMKTKGNRQYLCNIFGFNWLYHVSSSYGYRVHPISGDKEYHKGVDIAVPTGTPIMAGHDGKVTYSGNNGGYGLVVIIENEEGLSSKYAHCNELLISVGQEVKKGDIIAKSGNTGYSTGPHLHLEITKNGQYLNPLYFADTGDDGSGRLLPGTSGGIAFGDPGASMGDGSYAALIAEAEKHLGKPYDLGANGPNIFDCSSYISWILKYSGVKDVERTTAQGLFNLSTPVSSSDVMPGDLVFFTKTYSVSRPVTHVGLYGGNGMMIHAGSPIQYTSIETNYWREHFYSYARIN